MRHTPSTAFRHLPPLKGSNDVVNQCLECASAVDRTLNPVTNLFVVQCCCLVVFVFVGDPIVYAVVYKGLKHTVIIKIISSRNILLAEIL